MNPLKTVRVAALQMAAGTDVEANLSTALRLIDEAAGDRPDLMVLPEFVNHASWYDDQEHCNRVAVRTDGDFLRQIAERARRHSCFIVINVTLLREDDGIRCTGSSLLYDRRGDLLCVSDKQVLMGHENDFLQPARTVSPVIETEIGRIGLYSCMDGVVCETSRSLAVRGATILCNSLNSFAADEGRLHIPVRAAENKVFVVAANKVGALIPEEMLEGVGAAINIPPRFLYGAGDSQIVAPDGTVMVRAPVNGESIIMADLDLSRANEKHRPDGTHIMDSRRPEIYGPLLAADEPAPESGPVAGDDEDPRLRVAAVQPAGSSRAELLALTRQALQNHDLVVLPERSGLPEQDAAADAGLTTGLQELCGPEQHVVTSMIMEEGGRAVHCAVLIGEQGVLHRQPALHGSAAFPGMAPGADRIRLWPTPAGPLCLLTAADAIHPESFRLAALAGAAMVLLPGRVQESWETSTGLPERAAENRLCVVAASPDDSSLVLDLPRDFTIMTPWQQRVFDGNISTPLIRQAAAGRAILSGRIHPRRAANKVLSGSTNLIRSRARYPEGGLAGFND